MKLFGAIAVTLIYYAVILMAGIWYDFRAAALVIAASLCVAVVSHLVDEDECQDDEEPEHDSCAGCKHDLGGGCCRINLEDECAAGGGYEMWEDE